MNSPGRLKRGALWSLRWMRRHPVWSLLCVVALAISWWLSPETYPVRITV
ncbi:MAG: hypothetical protein HZC25_11145, partial [Rhodospirillales bacterium]|nr:hypothetical protein [Rhodospirillales bacterium]